jgi:TonB family protein
MKTLVRIFLCGVVVSQFCVLSPCQADTVIVKSKCKADATFSPDPEYPILARSRRHRGQGLYRLVVNDKTGVVDQVQVMKQTNSKELDAEAVMTLFKWKFRPGIKQCEVNVIFETPRANSLH